MRKSPFSTPRGYGGHRRYSHNKFNNSYETKINYNQSQNHTFVHSSPKMTPEPLQNDDFIPFNTSSPSTSTSFHEKRKSGNFFTPRGRRNNYSFNSQGSHNDSMSPKFYVDTSPSPSSSHRYDRTPKVRNSNFKKVPLDEIPMSEFFDMESTLEDPWKELMELYEKGLKKKKLDEPTKTSVSNEFHDFSINDSALENWSKCSDESAYEEKNAISSSEILESEEITSTSDD